MQQVLLNKVENIKKDFEKCSKLISRHKTTDLQEAKIEDKKPAKVEQKHRVVQKGRKNIKKDYLNCTPVIQVEILAEERSPFHHKEFGNYTCKNIDQEKIIKQSLTKIIEKNIRRYSTDTNTQKKCISNLKSTSAVKSTSKEKIRIKSESLTRIQKANEPKSKKYLERIKNQFNQGPNQIPITSRKVTFGKIHSSRSKSFQSPLMNSSIRHKSNCNATKGGKGALLCSSRGQELMKKYQGRYKMVNLDNSMSISCASSKSARDNPFYDSTSPKPVSHFKTTNAKEFREILRQSVQKKKDDSFTQIFRPEKEVKMNDLDLDFSSRKESLTTKKEISSEKCDRDHIYSTSQNFDIPFSIITPNHSEKKILDNLTTLVVKSSIKITPARYQRKYNSNKKQQSSGKSSQRRTTEFRAYDYTVV